MLWWTLCFRSIQFKTTSLLISDMADYKLSQFNNLTTHQDTYLLYNAHSDCLLALNKKAFAVFTKIQQQISVAISCSSNALQEKLNDFEKQLLMKFISGCFLVPYELDEISPYQKIFKETRQQNVVLTPSFHLTFACNFNCRYCFQRDIRPGEGEAKTMTQETGINAINFLTKEISQYRQVEAAWVGGEPLLHIDKILFLSKKLQEICEIYKKPLHNLIITNGYLLTAKNLDALSNIPNLMFQITLDGIGDIHDNRRHLTSSGSTFATILKNIGEAYSRFGKKNVIIRINVDDGNAEHLPCFLDFLEKEFSPEKNTVVLAYVQSYAESPIDDSIVNRTLLNYKRILDDILVVKGYLYKPFLFTPKVKATAGCRGVMRGDLIFDPEGNIYKCARFISPQNGIVGNVVEGINQKEYENWVYWNPFKQEKCCKCSILPLCMGGCPYPSLYQDRQSRCGDMKTFTGSHIIYEYLAM